MSPPVGCHCWGTHLQGILFLPAAPMEDEEEEEEGGCEHSREEALWGASHGSGSRAEACGRNGKSGHSAGKNTVLWMGHGGQRLDPPLGLPPLPGAPRVAVGQRGTLGHCPLWAGRVRTPRPCSTHSPARRRRNAGDTHIRGGLWVRVTPQEPSPKPRDLARRAQGLAASPGKRSGLSAALPALPGQGRFRSPSCLSPPRAPLPPGSRPSRSPVWQDRKVVPEGDSVSPARNSYCP